MKQHSKRFKVILGLVIVLTVLFIFRNSLMNREESAEESLKLYYLLKPLLIKIIPEKYFTHELLRKLAHFTEFGLLSFEMCILLMYDNFKEKVYKILFFGLFTAVIDETIQYFVGRGSMVLDCLIDFSGVVTVLIAFEVIRKLVMKKCKKETVL